MRNFKSEKGAITIIALASVLLITAFLISTYMVVSNKVKTQKDVVAETKKIYETDTAQNAYDSFFTSADVIPIYTEDQLLKIGSNENVYIKEAGGKYYTFADDATYVLMNDIVCNQDYISKSFEGTFDGNGHIITTVNEYDEECICNEENNYHGLLINLSNDYIDKLSNVVDDVPIPVGFKYVKGTKDTGVVITDAYSGLEDEGNEFVWIPVDGTNITFSKTAFNGEDLRDTETYLKYWCDETTDEFIALSASVAKYKGFYFGRYETSKIPDIEDNLPQIKKGYEPWTNIKESAFTKASNMYETIGNYDYYVSTHLVYPHEWDTTLNWIIATGAKTYADVATDSSAWGNYKPSLLQSGSIQNTGSSDAYAVNNIYDIAGNVGELTQELYGNSSSSVTNYSFRGGSYMDLGSDDQAGDRVLNNDAKVYYGFRICMMINL